MSWTLTTDAAAKYFGKRVGDTVDESDVHNAEGRNRPVTMGRLLSLQRQFRDAKSAGNTKLQAAVNRQYGREFTIYMEITGESATAVLNALQSANGEVDSAREFADAVAEMGLADAELDRVRSEGRVVDEVPGNDDDDSDLIVLNEGELLAHVWGIAARLVELNPDLRVSRVDQDTSIPIYIVHDDAEVFRLQFDLVASVWLSARGEEPTEYSWLDLLESDLPGAFVEELQELGAVPRAVEPTTTRRSAIYRLIGQILDLEAQSAVRWEVPNLTIHFSGQEKVGRYPGALLEGVHQAVDDFMDAVRDDVQLMGERRVHQPLWVLQRDDNVQVAVFDSNTGKVHLKDQVINVFGQPGGETRSVRALAAYILDNAQDPRGPEVASTPWQRNLDAPEDRPRQNESAVEAEPPAGAIDMVKTLDAAGLQVPPLGEFDLEKISRYRTWSWGTRHLSEGSLYMFEVEKVMSEAFEREPFFALCHAGHGVNSYGLNLVTSKGPVVAFVQHGWGGAYMDPADRRRRINETYGRIRTLFDQIEDPTAETRWGLVYSNFRGACGALDFAKFWKTGSFEESFTEIVKEGRARQPDEERLFEFVLNELYE